MKIETNKIYNADCLEILRGLEDNSIDLMFCDPPYALGSDVIILQNGKPEYQKARDFMDKWNQPNGEFWEAWYKEAIRVLKHGGHCLMFGLDRQLMLYKYYACFAGFVEKQSLYFYFIQNFPKASDLSKNLDKHFGEEREVVGVNKNIKGREKNNNTVKINEHKKHNITTPASALAKKYDGYKYSIAPLKQTNETIMVFQKPYKSGSCLHDTIAMENGDTEITCGALDIEGNRVGTEKITTNGGNKSGKNTQILKEGFFLETTHEGRFPSQTFCNKEAAKNLDGQSGISKSSGGDGSKFSHENTTVKISAKERYIKKGKNGLGLGDIGGCSKALHICDYEKEDYDIYNYCPKVSASERNKGLEGFEKKFSSLMAQDKWSLENMNFANKQPKQNNHPTVKPIKLLRKILSYFKTPNEQIILDCFMGSGSMGVSAYLENYKYIGVELDKEYFEIARKRIDNELKQTKLF